MAQEQDVPPLNANVGHGYRRHVKILVLDGGGVKCLSSLLILEEFMKELSTSNHSGVIEKPCKHFDLICGVQWGGVLALMLGRLELSVKECIDWMYEIDWDGTSLLRLYTPFHGKLNSRYFEHYFKRVVVNSDKTKGDQDALMYSPGHDYDAACKVMVVAYDIHGKPVPTIFRSYSNPEEKGRCEISLWKVALAAISNPYTMKPVSLLFEGEREPRTFIDASIVGYSNPSREALSEGKTMFNERSIQAVINIGTGDRAQVTTPTSLGSWLPTRVHLALIRLLRDVSSDPRRVAEELERDGIAGRFYARLSVESGLHLVHSMDFTKRSRRVVKAQAEIYLSSQHTMRNIIGWATELKTVSTREGNTSAIVNDSLSVATSTARSTELFDTMSKSESKIDTATTLWIKQFTTFVKPFFRRDAEESPSRRIKVAILDTGIDPTHPFFLDKGKQPKYCSYHDFTKSQEDASADIPVDTCGHGTQMAGIILELAPHVELYVARVFEGRNFGDKEAARIAEAISYATVKWEVNIISMSFGFDSPNTDIVSAIEAAHEKDIVMLAAVSNHGNRPLRPIAFPAQHPYVICINSSDGNGNKSSFNPHAPNGRGKTRRSDNFSVLGESVRSCWPQNIEKVGVYERAKGKGSWLVSSGSSVATAIATSIAALIMEIGERNLESFPRPERLKSYRGIQKIFTLMSGEDELDGFKNIRPWYVFYGYGNEVVHRISKEIKNP